MNPQIKILAPIGLAVLALVIYASAFIVNQWEVAIKLRLGEIVDSEYKPGLHFMVPLINNVKTFDARIQTHDSRPQRFLTVEKKDVIVDYYAKWRITNPGQFYRSTGGDSTRTARLLAERINTGLRDEFGRRTIQEVVSEDRYQLMDELTKEADRQASELGIEVVDVRVKKIDLPPEVSESVYERMRAERERVARDLRAKGGEAAERIRADADRQRTVIIADAYKVAEEARGEGDAKAAETYAKAYNQDRDFYSFYRSLNAYRAAFGQGGDMLVLQPDSDFFRYFNKTGLMGATSAEVGREVTTPALPAKSAPVKAPLPAVAPPRPVAPVNKAPVGAAPATEKPSAIPPVDKTPTPTPIAAPPAPVKAPVPAEAPAPSPAKAPVATEAPVPSPVKPPVPTEAPATNPVKVPAPADAPAPTPGSGPAPAPAGAPTRLESPPTGVTPTPADPARDSVPKPAPQQPIGQQGGGEMESPRSAWAGAFPGIQPHQLALGGI